MQNSTIRLSLNLRRQKKPQSAGNKSSLPRKRVISINSVKNLELPVSSSYQSATRKRANFITKTRIDKPFSPIVSILNEIKQW